MAKTKHHREQKRQLGQFLTPEAVAENILSKHRLTATDRVLEPGFGSGAFLLPLIDRFMHLRGGNLAAVLADNVWGIELDAKLYAGVIEAIEQRWGPLPDRHHLVNGDFLLEDYGPLERHGHSGHETLFEEAGFDLIVGNPPFGGTVSVEHQDRLERRYGRRNGLKIKKETYAFFTVKALDLVRDGGTLEFICSDTFLTIPTMKGLRRALMDEGSCEVIRMDEFSPETSYPMVVLRFVRGTPSSEVTVEHRRIGRSEIERTNNFSWRAGGEFSKYFAGPVLGDMMIASSGMTTGKNEYFVREIVDGTIEEPYEFEFFDDPITLDREIERARLGKLSDRQKAKILAQQSDGVTRRNVHIAERSSPTRVSLPHPDYRYYNKAQPGLFYASPRYAIYWADEGDAVLTFKRNGNWYLHGVGGAPYFLREGLTWRLISSRLDVRYLPEGYILDSGAPCAFLREGVGHEELWFVLGWTVTDAASAILKGVLNHTMNIQSKDFERLPYPWWVSLEHKRAAIKLVARLVERAQSGVAVTRSDDEFASLDRLYAFPLDSGQPRVTEHYFCLS